MKCSVLQIVKTNYFHIFGKLFLLYSHSQLFLSISIMLEGGWIVNKLLIRETLKF